MDEASIVALLMARARQIGIEPSTDANVQRRIDEAARRAAAELLDSGKADVNLPFLAATAAGPLHLQVHLPADAGDASGPRVDPRVKLS